MKEIPCFLFHYFERTDFNMTASLIPKWALADIILSEVAQAF